MANAEKLIVTTDPVNAAKVVATASAVNALKADGVSANVNARRVIPVTNTKIAERVYFTSNPIAPPAIVDIASVSNAPRIDVNLVSGLGSPFDTAVGDTLYVQLGDQADFGGTNLSFDNSGSGGITGTGLASGQIALTGPSIIIGSTYYTRTRLYRPSTGAYSPWAVGPSFLAQAQGVHFDGATYLTHSGALTGAANGKSGLLSLWIRNTQAVGGYRDAFLITISGSTNALALAIDTATGAFYARGFTSGAVKILDIETTTALVSMSNYANVIMSWNLATPRGQVYVNNVSDIAASPTLTNNTINYAATNGQSVGASPAGTNSLTGDMADLQLWLNVDVDISVAANRANFINATTLEPVDQSVAATAFGTQTVLMSGALGAWATNKGSGGGFTANGTLTAAASNP